MEELTGNMHCHYMDRQRKGHNQTEYHLCRSTRSPDNPLVFRHELRTTHMRVAGTKEEALHVLFFRRTQP